MATGLMDPEWPRVERQYSVAQKPKLRSSQNHHSEHEAVCSVVQIPQQPSSIASEPPVTTYIDFGIQSTREAENLHVLPLRIMKQASGNQALLTPIIKPRESIFSSLTRSTSVAPHHTTSTHITIPNKTINPQKCYGSYQAYANKTNVTVSSSGHATQIPEVSSILTKNHFNVVPLNSTQNITRKMSTVITTKRLMTRRIQEGTTPTPPFVVENVSNTTKNPGMELIVSQNEKIIKDQLVSLPAKFQQVEESLVQIPCEEATSDCATDTRRVEQVITTQPSSVSCFSTASAEITSMWHRALTHLGSIRKTLTGLEKAIQSEFVDLCAYDAAVRQSELILHDVTHNLCTAYDLIKSRKEQLDDAEKRVRILMADDVSDCSLENLEDVSDLLWSGLHAATLALSKRQDPSYDDSKVNDRNTLRRPDEISSSVERFTINVPEAKFQAIPTPATTATGPKAEELCVNLIQTIQGVRTIKQKTRQQQEALNTSLEKLQDKIKKTNEEYDTERANLLQFEKKLATRLRQINRLTGRDSYESMTIGQLSELCKTINKASRRLATEQAIREVRAKQQANTIETHKQNENAEKCFVCFERNWNCRLTPCNHTLCSDCAGRLKFCPQCRQAVESTHPIKQEYRCNTITTEECSNVEQ